MTKKNGHVEAILEFTCLVSSLEAYLNGNAATCVSNGDGTWRVILDGVVEEELPLTVIANGSLLPGKVVLKVRTRGISRNADPFGGMGL